MTKTRLALAAAVAAFAAIAFEFGFRSGSFEGYKIGYAKALDDVIGTVHREKVSRDAASAV